MRLCGKPQQFLEHGDFFGGQLHAKISSTDHDPSLDCSTSPKRLTASWLSIFATMTIGIEAPMPHIALLTFPTSAALRTKLKCDVVDGQDHS